MAEARSSRVWRTVSGALGGVCLYLVWVSPPAESELTPAADDDEVTTRAAGSGSARCRSRLQDAGLSTAALRVRLDQLARARSTQARCLALQRLGAVASAGAVAVAELARHARSPFNTDVRECAISALGSAQVPEAAAALIELSRSHGAELSEATRTALADALAEHNEAAARNRLLELARSDDAAWRVAACLALADAGAPEALDAISDTLGRASRGDAESLIIALGKTHDARALGVLREILRGDSETHDLAVVQALGELGSAEATQELLQLLAQRKQLGSQIAEALALSGDPGARQALLAAADGGNLLLTAEVALESLHDVEGADVRAVMLRALRSGDDRAYDAMQYFAEHDDASVLPELLELARNGSYARAQQSVQVLSSLGGSAAVGALESLALGGGRMQVSALHALAELPEGGERARDAARSLLEREPGMAASVLAVFAGDDSEETRLVLTRIAEQPGQAGARALRILARHDDPEAQEFLARQAREGSNRHSALWALADARSPEAVPAARAALKSDDPELRVDATRVLGRTGGPEAEQVLLAASADSSTDVVSSAIVPLANLATPRTLQRLEQLAESAEGHVAGDALEALLDAAPERAPATFERALDRGKNELAVRALGSAHALNREAALNFVERALARGDASVVDAALQQLHALANDRDELHDTLARWVADPALPAATRAKVQDYAAAQD